MSDENVEKATDETKSMRGLVITGVFAFVTGLFGGGGLGVWLADRFFPENNPPVAAITVNAEEGTAPFELKLDGSTSTDPDGDTLSFTWLIDDQKIADNTVDTVVHTIDAPGKYYVILKAKDPKGLTNTALKQITLNAPFDRAGFLGHLSDIKDYIERGLFDTAISLTEEVAAKCDSAPPKDCAQFHGLRSKAFVATEEFPKAQAAMGMATELHPDHLLYAVDYAGLLVLNGRFSEAAEELQRIGAGETSPIPVYMLALAEAIEGKYDPALSRLDSVSVTTSPAIRHRAALGAALIKWLKNPDAPRDATDQELRRLACADGAVLRLLDRTETPKEADFYCLEKLLKRYVEGHQDGFHANFGTLACV